MARLRLLWLILIPVASLLAATSASALQWLLDGRPIEGTVHVHSSGSMLLADLAAPRGGTYMECEGSGEGSIGPLAHDEITSITAEKCKFQTGRNGECEAGKTVTARAVNLPWLTLLVTVGGEIRDDILPSKAGKNPGWNIECTVLEVFKVQDECTGASASLLMSNVAGGVVATSSEEARASCSLGTASSGMAIGSPLVENPGGHTISVSNSPNG
jgi:hypothetical protein